MDIRVLILGFVAIAISVMAILLFKRKQKPFEDWFKEVEFKFFKHDYSVGYVEGLSKREWMDWWAEGLTPQEAFTEYFEKKMR